MTLLQRLLRWLEGVEVVREIAPGVLELRCRRCGRRYVEQATKRKPL